MGNLLGLSLRLYPKNLHYLQFLVFSCDIERPEQPIESELLEIILGDLHKLRFDFHLFRSRDIRLFNERVDQVEIVGRVTHDEPAGLRQEIRTCSRREGNPLDLKKIFRGFAVYELPAAS